MKAKVKYHSHAALRLAKTRVTNGAEWLRKDIGGCANPYKQYYNSIELSYGKKIVLHSRSGYRKELDALIEDFISAGVIYVGVAGEDASLIEDIIDEICVGDASNVYDMLTSSHPNETLEEAVEFARGLGLEFAGDVQVVEF